jgi:hypothetical protein
MASKGEDYDEVHQEVETFREDIKKKSSRSGIPSRYFAVDPGYDKRVYENDWKNVLVVIAVFILFYMFNVFYWWGLTAFGTAYPSAAMWYSVAAFASTVLWGCGMLFSGYKANQKLYRWEFYMEKIND